MMFCYNCILAGLNTEKIRLSLESFGYSRIGDTNGTYIVTSREGDYICCTEREFMIMRYGGKFEDHVMSVKNEDYFLSVAKMRKDTSEGQEYVLPREEFFYDNLRIPYGKISTSDTGDHRITLYEVKEKYGVEHSYKFEELSVGYTSKAESIDILHFLRGVLRDIEIDLRIVGSRSEEGYITLSRTSGVLGISEEPQGHLCGSLKEFVLLALATEEWDLNQYRKVRDSISFSTDFCCCGGDELDKESIVEKIREEI